MNKTLVTIGGILYLIFGVFHMTFFRFFSKSPDFAQIKPFLSKIIQMLNIGVITFFLMLGVTMLVYRNEILTTKLGRAFLIVSSAFFIIRGAAEFFFNEPVLPLVGTMLVCSVLYMVPVINSKK